MMSNFFGCVLAIVLYFIIGFIIGFIVVNKAVATKCDKLGAFYDGQHVYECQRVEGTRKLAKPGKLTP